jgi:hypothetical protein
VLANESGIVNEMVSKNEAKPKNETFVASVPATATVVRSHGILPSNEENTQTYFGESSLYF